MSVVRPCSIASVNFCGQRVLLLIDESSMSRLFTLVSLICFQIVYGFAPSSISKSVAKVIFSPSRLLAHHPQKKIIKRKQDRRPKKHRLSDINRSNINFGKCITKLENAPADYTIVPAADFAKVRADALNFWENGSPTTEWLEITDEDMSVALPQNIEPLPVGGVQKRPNIVKSGSC